MKPVAITIPKFSAILLSLFLIFWWAVDYSSLNIPEYIPYTPIKVYGLLLVSAMLTVTIFAQKELLTIDKSLNIKQLTTYSTAIYFLVQVIFQFILSFTFANDKLYHFVRGTVFTTFIFAGLAFFVAFQLKTKNTNRLLLYILIITIIFNVIIRIFPSLAAKY